MNRPEIWRASFYFFTNKRWRLYSALFAQSKNYSAHYLKSFTDYSFWFLLGGHKHATSFFFKHKFLLNASMNTVCHPKNLGGKNQAWVWFCLLPQRSHHFSVPSHGKKEGKLVQNSQVRCYFWKFWDDLNCQKRTEGEGRKFLPNSSFF